MDERRQRVQEHKKPENDFEAFSKRWIAERLKTKSAMYRAQIESRRDTPKTAEGIRTIIQQTYNDAIQKLLVEVNPALPLRGVIEVPAAEPG
jgi:hypothetical protein